MSTQAAPPHPRADDRVRPGGSNGLARAPTPNARPERRRRALVSAALVVLWLGMGSVLAAWFSGQIRDWQVMTDELLYTKLATSMAETGSPVPRIHETWAAVYNLLYPLLLAPLYGTLSPPDAFRAAHVLNAFVMTSAVFPAYLLARQVLSRRWSFAVSALSITVVWMVFTGYLMTESVAYPAFLWALLALQRSIARPSRRSDVLAAAAIGFAVLARTQFVVLLLVLPLAIIGHELGRARLARGSQTRRRALLEGASEALRRHRLLAALYVIAGAAGLVLAVGGSLGAPLGTYADTLEEGSILPWTVWPIAALHLDAVALGLGFAPLVLGVGWMLATVAHDPRSEREHALAMLSLVTVILLMIEASSFSIRFSGVTPSDRYAFYVAPLLLVGTVAAVTCGRRRQIATGAAFATIFFAETAWGLPFLTYRDVWVATPASVVNDFLVGASGPLGTGAFVVLAGLVVGLVLVLAVLLLPRTVMPTLVVVSLFAFSLVSLYSGTDRLRSSTSIAGRPLAGPPGHVLDWVDSALPADATAAVISFPVSRSSRTSAIRWWDVEFWNRSITQAYVSADGSFTYTAWPRRTLAVDWTTGKIPGTSDAPPFVVAAADDPRFLVAGEQRASHRGLVVRSATRPYRAVWASRGLDADQRARPGRPATIRIFPVSGRTSHLARARVSLGAPDGKPAQYRISAPGAVRVGRLAGEGLRQVELLVCVPARSPVDVIVTARSNAARVGPISVAHTRRACQP